MNQPSFLSSDGIPVNNYKGFLSNNARKQRPTKSTQPSFNIYDRTNHKVHFTGHAKGMITFLFLSTFIDNSIQLHQLQNFHLSSDKISNQVYGSTKSLWEFLN
jgi:hypothetical protein